MSWAKFSDDAHESEHILALSVPARWLWASAIIANRGYRDGRSAFMSRARAEALARHQDVPVKHIKELEHGGRWEPVEGGWNIHDYEEFLPSRREEASDHEPNPIKRAAGLKSAAQRQQTGSRPAAHIKEEGQQDGNPARASRVDPVPEPVPVPEPQEAPPVAPRKARGAVENGQDLGLQLAVRVTELLGRDLTLLEVNLCTQFIDEYAYLSVDDVIERMRSQLEWAKTNGHDAPVSLAWFTQSLRVENDHRADQGHPKAARVHLGRTAGMTRLGDLIQPTTMRTEEQTT